MEYKGYRIGQSVGHGKNVSGNKKTATMRVIEDLGTGFMIRKQFSFLMGNNEARQKAIYKCKKWIDDNLTLKTK